MKKISLKTFLLIVYSLITVLFVGMGIYFLLRIDYANKARTFANDFQNLYLEWNIAQHAQHDFFIKYKNDPVFFQTEQSKYLRRSQVYTSEIVSKIDSLSTVPFVVKNGFDKDLLSFKDNIENVEDIFEQLVHLLFIRGSQKTGVIGDCFSFYNLASNYAGDIKTQYYLSQMNSSLLKYLNHPSFEYYQNFLNIFTVLNLHVSPQKIMIDTSNIDTTAYISKKASVSADFISNVNSYKRSFSKLVSIDRKIFLNEQSNLMISWADANHGLGNIFNTSVKTVDNFRKNIVSKVQVQILVLLFIIVSIFIIISITLPRSISKRVDELIDFIEPLKIGQIPEYKFEPKAFTEVIEMSDTIEHVITSLRNASNFAKEIGKGNFSYDFKPVSDKDELGNALILLRDNLQKAQQEEQQRRKEDEIRQWTNIGIAKFSDILRQSAKDISELSVVIIKELVKYLDANQGGVFIMQQEGSEEPVLNLVASYAYSKERKKRKQFALGEGLIGTCAVEKAPIYMTDIPDDYISITSGLGGANPRSLLIVPLLFEENVLGVVEIASFNEFEKYQIEFVERIAESIASSISITKINERTAKLLETAKMEAEQRALKEEELRQNLEELQATQERAAMREKELNDLINLINKVAFIIELDIDGNIVHVPDRMTSFFNLQRNEIIGRHLSEFDFQPNTELAQPEFWQKLLEGKEQQHIHKFVGLDKTYWVNDYIVPSVDAAGNVAKYVCILFDVTEQTKLQNELAEQTEELKKKEQEIVEKVKELEATKNRTEELLAEIQGTMQGVDKTVLRAEYSPDGIFLDANELHQKVLGYRKENMIGKSILEFIAPEERENFEKFWKEVAAGNQKELTVKRKNIAAGTDIWLINQYNPILDVSGNVIKILYLAIDITAQKITEDRINKLLDQSKTQAEHLRKLFEYSSDAIQVLADGKFIDCNPATLELFGYESKDEFINISPADVSPEKQPDGSNSMEKANKMIQKALEEGIAEFDWIHRKKDGTDFPCKVTLSAYRIDNEVYVYAMVKDLS